MERSEKAVSSFSSFTESAGGVLVTRRLLLEPVTVPMIEAAMLGQHRRFEALVDARLPAAWPDARLIEQGFSASLDAIRADPEKRLWGDRLIVTREGERRVLGSVIFHGRPDEDGIAEVGYGVEEGSRRQGVATEATRACVDWALAQPFVRAVSATTIALNIPSVRLIEKLGMKPHGEREHPLFGELHVYAVFRS